VGVQQEKCRGAGRNCLQSIDSLQLVPHNSQAERAGIWVGLNNDNLDWEKY